MILTLLGMAVVAPQAVGARDWITPEDYPIAALRGDRSGHTAFRLSVLPSGKPFRCDVTSPSGWKDLDQQTCRLIMKRARFEPIFDPTGAPAYLVYRNANSFWIPGGPPAPTPKPSLVDIALSVKALPTGLSSPTEVNLAYTVDPAGRIADCTPYVGAFDKKKSEAVRAIETLGPVACQELMTSYRPTPATNERGHSVLSIQTARLSFSEVAE